MCAAASSSGWVPSSDAPQATSDTAGAPRDPLATRPPFDFGGGRLWFGLALGGFAAGYVFSAVLLAIFAAATHNTKNLAHLESLQVPPWWVTIAGLVGLWIGFVGAVVIASRSKGSGNPLADFGFRFGRWDAPVGIVVGVAGQVVVDLLYLPFEHVYPNLSHDLDEPANRLTGGFHGTDLAVIAFLTIVVVPLVEEMFFRGLVLQSLVRVSRGLGRVLGPATGIVVTGVLFGLAHAEPIELAGLALFGVVLCVLAYRTGRLGPGIFAHAAFNAFAVISIALQGRVIA